MPTTGGTGGFCGYNWAGTISNCYASGSATGVSSGRFARVSGVGGMVGNQYAAISNCYSTGRVVAQASGTNANSYYVGGFLGEAQRASSACFWDKMTSGMTTGVGHGTASGVSGNTTGEMMTRSTFTDADWDFNDTWLMIESITYPCLNGIYQRPRIDIYDHQTVVEDVHVTMAYDVSCSDYPSMNDEKSVNLSTNASSWLTWNATLRTLRGTPTNSEVGHYWINITAEDLCGGVSWNNVTFEVLNVNDPPVIVTRHVRVAPEDALYSVDYEAMDEDPTNDTLTWDMTTTAGWLTFNDTTGELSGTPTNDDVGLYLVNISVSDGKGGRDVTSFTLVVENTNDDPVIVTAHVDETDEDAPYDVYYHATDVDPTNDEFTWSLDTDAGWLSMTENHLHGVPGNDAVGTFNVSIAVSDGNGGTAHSNFTLWVYDVNDPPTITSTDLTEATEDVLYSVVYEALDIDPMADTMTWKLSTTADWLTIDPQTGVLSGTPANDDVGSILVNVSVSDGRGGEDRRSFMLVVHNSNDDPEITTDPVTEVSEDEAYSVYFRATDVDPTHDTLTWSLETEADWLSMNGNHLSGTPGSDDVGSFLVNVTVLDEHWGTDTLEFLLTVVNVNDVPIISTVPTKEAVEDEEYSFTMEALDADSGDDIAWSLVTDATWLSIEPRTGLLTGLPSNDDVGSFKVTIMASDGVSHDSIEFLMTVENTNDGPEWLSVPEDLKVTEGTPLLLKAIASDIDEGDVITYSILSVPEFEMMIDQTSGMMIWTEPKTGTYSVTVLASDGDMSVHHTFELVVKERSEEKGIGADVEFYIIISILLALVSVLAIRLMVMGKARTPTTSEETTEDSDGEDLEDDEDVESDEKDEEEPLDD